MIQDVAGLCLGGLLDSGRLKSPTLQMLQNVSRNGKLKIWGIVLGLTVSKLYNSTCPVRREYHFTGASCASVEFTPEGRQISHWTGGILRLCIAFLEMGACVFFAHSPCFRITSYTSIL